MSADLLERDLLHRAVVLKVSRFCASHYGVLLTIEYVFPFRTGELGQTRDLINIKSLLVIILL